MGLLKLLGISTAHDGQHAAGGQRGTHAKGAKPKPPKNPKPPRQ